MYKTTIEFEEARACDEAYAKGIDDAQNERVKILPNWITERYGRFSEVARFYDIAYDDTKR